MAHEIVMPQLGLTMTEGAVTSWIKQPGERVEKGEMLFTVQTDKIEMEVESTSSGFVNTLVESGKVVPVGTIIAILTDHSEETVALQSKVEAKASGPDLNGSETYEGGRAQQPSTGITLQKRDDILVRDRDLPASPRARALAKSLGLDIKQVPAASGGRVVEEDVRRYHAGRPQPKTTSQSSVRRITAERTSQSFARAPHFYLGVELNAEKLVQMRGELQATAQRRSGTKLTYTDFLLKAVASALVEEPAANAYWEDGSIVSFSSVDVGLAVQTPSGLLVPVIRKTDSLTIFEIAHKRNELAERARAGALRMEELTGGSATLSNLGSGSVDWFEAILNPPQSVILAAGSLRRRPMVIDDRIAAVHSLILTLSVDHRVLDGVAGAMFLTAIKRILENPHELLI